MSENSLILPSAYLPPISYFRAANKDKEVTLEVWEHYIKQTIRNRCWIDSPLGPLALTVPIVKNEGKTPMKDIRISDHGNWRHQHWNALVSNYGQSSFFEFYADDFAPFYEKKWTFLVDFNEDLLHLLTELLDIPLSITHTSSYCGLSDWQEENATSRPYYQVFAAQHPFLSDLSIVDLLFNMGNESILYL